MDEQGDEREINYNFLTFVGVERAISFGKMESLKWLCKEKGGFISKDHIMHAAREGRLPIFKFLVENGATMDSVVLRCAAERGHVHILDWAVANGCPVGEDKGCKLFSRFSLCAYI